MNALTTIASLTANDFGRQKRRLSIGLIVSCVAAIMIIMAVAFGLTATAIWLSVEHGLVVALVLVSAFCLSVGACLIIANAFYQRRQKRKLARSAAVKSIATASLLSVAKNNAAIAPLVVAALGFIVASKLASSDESDMD
ncbi:MAG: hypothetical protein WA921_01320 [Ahrensia sp.]